MYSTLGSGLAYKKLQLGHARCAHVLTLFSIMLCALQAGRPSVEALGP